MDLAKADLIARALIDHLNPWCDRIEVAGSIRRRKPEVGDIELVVIPKDESAKMSIFQKLLDAGTRVKGQPNGKYIQWHMRAVGPHPNKTDDAMVEYFTLDLFYATPKNWGLQLAIRTGSAAYSHKVLATGWTRKGYHAAGGVLFDSHGHPTYIREERELFELIGRPYEEPQYRDERTHPNLI